MWPPLKTTFPKRAWHATLAGTADDPGGARGRPGADGRQRTPLAGPASDPGGDRLSGTRKKSLAGDPGGGGRPWRGATLALQDVAPLKTTWQDVAPTKNHMARCGPH